MNNDLIKRSLAISYAISGLVRRIDGEVWIRTSEVKQSLNDVPTVEAYTSEDLAKYISTTEDLVREKLERPQGDWIAKEETPASVSYYCSVCKAEGIPITPFCPWCGAYMKGEMGDNKSLCDTCLYGHCCKSSDAGISWANHLVCHGYVADTSEKAVRNDKT